MTRSKKIFLIIAAIFLVIVALIAYDFSTRTTFPGRSSRQSDGQTPATQR